MRRLRVGLLGGVVVLGALVPLTGARGGTEVPFPTDAVTANGLDRCSPDGVAHTSLELTPDGTSLPAGAEPVLRFVQLSDSHIIDDDGPDVANGTVTEVVLDPAIANTSATFLNEELTDEVLNAMIGTINACHDADPLALTITTGDITDTNWLNVVRRVIDNIDGASGQPTAFEELCGYLTHDSNGARKAGAPPDCPIPADLLAIPTGRLAADAQQPDGPNGGPDVEHDPTYQLGTTRALRQALESAATAAAGGSATIAAGLPPSLRCQHTEAGCANTALAIPYYAVFGNHDVTVKGTVSYQAPFGPPLTAFGRYFFESKREFINEWFATSSQPAGHGFHHAGARLGDADDRNDGWYSFPVPIAGGGAARFVVLDTTYDGVEQAVHRHGDTTTDTGGHVSGNEVTDPGGLEAGFLSHDQLQWLAGELESAAAAGEPVLVFSHHPDRTFVERQYPWARVEATAVELDQLLGRASHGGSPSTVVAHVAGHTHANRVSPCRPGDCPIGDGAPDEVAVERPFWRFETASLINWPQEGRIVELFAVPGGYALRLTMISPDQNDSAAARSRRLSGYEEMCSVYAMTGGPARSGPYDQGRLETALTNVANRDFCPNRGGVAVGAGTPAGSAADRDVLLLP